MAADFDLPNECWECVIKFLHSDHCSLESLSLVSKQFLSDTNRLRFSLTISDPTIPFLPRLFHRFTNLTSLDLTFFSGDLNALLRQISYFPFYLKSLKLGKHYPIPEDGFRILATKMKTLTSLTAFITKTDIVLIAECFPFLEEVDLNFPKSNDRDTNILPLALPKLRKINISGYYSIDDSSLFHLCKICEFLEELVIVMFAYYRSLTSLAEAGLPLKRLVIKRCMHYSYAGIFCLLSKCRFLQHLDLESVHFLIDQQVAELSLFLGNLVSINLSHSKMLTDLALFALVKNCRFLGDIRMEYTGIGQFSLENYNSSMDFVVYPQVKSLHLANNSWLSDESMKKFASIFPNLQVLDTSDCDLTESIVEVLRSCKIMHLSLIECPKLELLGMDFQVPKLEILNLSKSEIDDQTLYMISKNFSRLRQLDLQQCYRITEKGVRQVVENCTRLREINIRYCRNVAADVDFWLAMVFLRPSLRKIIAPSHFGRSDSKWIPLLDHGCLVC
ncbi:hypothetical protein TSUD_259120 [Trifolium subterraneum]|uniref:F-box/LRR-repeat protein 15-like leucin rich repeat domain-containing protein n=1 Tax=Trifolium subterraneum TaxID=3900 RepID=A0A2Z6NDU2_TRISU|nr:hypothetical protein TSUD_259120 [Trifolium subterraneum]